ncbi:MAG: ABC transporter permease subunit [Clostridia bacterium]|nr:ABC transporter permease subunit [Clostridia bacterium]
MKKGLRIPGPVRYLISLAFWVAVWWTVSSCVNSEVLIPSPPAVAVRLWSLMGTPDFYTALLFSVARIVLGFAIAVLSGAVLGVLSAKSRIADTIISPVLSVIKATPVASFIILALVWIDKDLIPAFISALMVLPIIHGNTREGILSAGSDLLEMARVFGLSRSDRLKMIYFPSLMPYLIAGLRTSLGLAWKAGVAAEVLSLAANSIGKNLYNSKIYLETADMFAWTAVVIIMSIILERFMMLLLGSLQRKKRYADDKRPA